MKNWFRKQLAKIKTWVIALLVTLGLVVPIMAATKDFTYTPATAYEDGTALPLDQILETRLYCNLDPAPVNIEPGASGAFSVTLAPGQYTCFATHVATNGLESAPSNSVIFEVLPVAAPNPPENVQVN